MEDYTDERNSEVPQIEDYGTTDTDTDTQDGEDYNGTTTDQDSALDQDSSDDSDDDGLDDDDLEGGTAFDQQSGGYTGGTLGTSQGSGEGGQFGQYGDTGIGTDLTDEMNAAEGDIDSGLVKGGETGDDVASGLGQYGGAAGGLTDETN